MVTCQLALCYWTSCQFIHSRMLKATSEGIICSVLKQFTVQQALPKIAVCDSQVTAYLEKKKKVFPSESWMNTLHLDSGFSSSQLNFWAFCSEWRWFTDILIGRMIMHFVLEYRPNLGCCHLHFSCTVNSEHGEVLSSGKCNQAWNPVIQCFSSDQAVQVLCSQ